jgi:hypothetical protein
MNSREKSERKVAKENKLRQKKPWKGPQLLELRLRVPSDLAMICKLINVGPEAVIRDFISCLATENSRKKPEAVKAAVIDFFIKREYGNDQYTEEEIRQMFKELAKINDLWPEDANAKFINQHVYWRRRYWKYWFKKWYWKLRRKKSDETQPFQ